MANNNEEKEKGNKRITIALAGNPNSGKSTIFNALTGSWQHVGNYPGVTVEKKEGKTKHKGYEILVVDLPGIYSLSAYSLEEVVARNYILEEKPDVVIDIADASNLERHLYLATQLMELETPMVLALNMFDLAKARGLKIDIELMQEIWGLPVVPTVGSKNQGAEELLDAIIEVATTRKRPRAKIRYGEDLEEDITALEALIIAEQFHIDKYPPRWLAIKLLEQDKELMKLLEDPAGVHVARQVNRSVHHLRTTLDEEPEYLFTDGRYGYIHGLTLEVVRREAEDRRQASDRIDRILLNRALGPVLLVFIVYFLFKFIFVASEAPTALLEAGFNGLANFVDSHLADGLLKSLIISGIIDGLGGVMGFLPIIMLMFLAIAILEDSGYMARIAFLMDRIMRHFGLHGNSVLSLIISGGLAGGCAVPGVMATRTLKDEKERLATILVTPLMNCGAKLPIYALMISAFFTGQKAKIMLLLTVISWIFAMTAARVLRKTILKGPVAPFVMELPPYRYPTFKGLLIHMWERTWHYIQKAGTIILAFSIIMWAAMTFPQLPEDVEIDYSQRIESAVQTGNEESANSIRDEYLGKKLEYSLAGRMGQGLEVIFAPMGFDYRINIALIGGLAAKELVVSTLGTAYSLGETDEESGNLVSSLQQDDSWTPLSAFCLILFVMLYSPCLATLAVIKKESGAWKWAGFAVLYSTLLAYVVALLVSVTGRALGLGG